MRGGRPGLLARRVVRGLRRSARRAPAQHPTPGPARRSLTVGVLADGRWAAALQAEWQQVASPQVADVPALDALVVQWPPAHEGLADAALRAAASARVPAVVLDTSEPGAALVPPVGARVVASTPERAADYTDAVPVVQVPFAQRTHNPAGATRRREVVAVGAGADRADVAARAASGAVVVAPPSRTDLADLAVVTDDPFLRDALARHRELRDRYAQPSVRAALSQHAGTVAASALLAAVGVADPAADDEVSIVVPTMRPGQLDHVMAFVARQAHARVQLVLVAHGIDLAAAAREAAAARGVSDLVVLEADRSDTLGALMNLGVAAADGRYVAKMDDDNFYGADYLGDLVRTFGYSGAQVAGKWAHYTYLEGSGATFLRFPDSENTFTSLVQGGTLLMPREVARELRFEDLPRRVDTTFLEKVHAAGGTVYSADRFGFVSVRAATTAGHTWRITDTELLAKPSGEPFYGAPWAHVEV